MNPFPTFTLTEWQAMTLPHLSLSAGDRRLVANLKERDTGRLDVTELRQGIQIKAYSWVGVIRFENFEIRVRPKLTGGNVGLVDMLSLTGGLSTLRRNRGHRQLAIEESIHLLDLIALLFADACQRIVSGGLLNDYVEQESELPVLRGRLLVGQQVRQFYSRVDRLACRYDDHQSDIIENQILAVALLACRSRVSHPTVRLKIHRLHTIFASACTAEALTDLNSARMNIYYHRQNEHYREAHELAWLLLDCMGVNDLLAVGKTRSFAFLLDMNQLFELFIARLVGHALQFQAYRIHPQRRDRSIIWDVMRKRPYTHVVPDILIESTDGRFLTVDAKYKLYDEKRLSTADIYQSFFYAYAYNDAVGKQPSALLLYPSSGQRERLNFLQIRGQEWGVKAQLQALSISIPQAISEIKENILGPISQVILEAVGEFLEAEKA